MEIFKKSNNYPARLFCMLQTFFQKSCFLNVSLKFNFPDKLRKTPLFLTCIFPFLIFLPIFFKNCTFVETKYYAEKYWNNQKLVSDALQLFDLVVYYFLLLDIRKYY